MKNSKIHMDAKARLEVFRDANACSNLSNSRSKSSLNSCSDDNERTPLVAPTSGTLLPAVMLSPGRNRES